MSPCSRIGNLTDGTYRVRGLHLTSQTRPERAAETVREIAEEAMRDAIEITLLIGLLKVQNAGGVNDKLANAGASEAAKALRNALVAREPTQKLGMATDICTWLSIYLKTR